MLMWASILLAAANIYDAFLFPAAVWRAAVLWRWCFIVGFIILGPVSLIIGIVYRTIYKRRLWAAWRSTTAPS